MDKLTEEEHLISKQYNSKIYLVNQKVFKLVSENEIKEVDDELDQTKSDLVIIKQENNKLQNELKNLTTSITNEELDKKLADLRKEVNEMEKKLKKIETGNIVKIPEEKVKEANNIYTRELSKYRKTKKICNHILDNLADGLEMNKKDFNVNMLNFRN
jgi:septal ring factor EnvC (AmiA/AmiB activator)